MQLIRVDQCPQPKKHSPKPGRRSPLRAKAKGVEKRTGMCLEHRPILEPNAAGIDIGGREIFVAVPPDRAEDPVQVFSTFTWRTELGTSLASVLTAPLRDQPTSTTCASISLTCTAA